MTFVGTLFLITLAGSFDTCIALILVELKGYSREKHTLPFNIFICSLVFFSLTSFSTSFSLRTFQSCSARTEQKFSFLSLQISRNPSKIFRHAAFSVWFSPSLVVWKVNLHLRRACHNKSCGHLIFHTTNKPCHSSYIRKYATRFPDAAVVVILRVFISR